MSLDDLEELGQRESFEDAQAERETLESCGVCGALEGDCDCCLECRGDGYIEDGGCGGGCDFCRPFPRCSTCGGTGKVRR